MSSPRLAALLRRAPLPAAASRRLSGHRGDGWRAYLLRTVTGQLGPSLDPVGGSWAVELNAVESGSVTVRKSDLGTIPPRWYTPWYGGVALTYTHDGVERPIVAGPILGWPSETPDEITFDFVGMRALLARRYVVAENGHLTKSDVKMSGLSYGDMAWTAVQTGMDKPGGSLPIVHGMPVEPVPSNGEQVFSWWNVPNNNLDAFLSEVSGYENGPDIMFRPRWANENRSALQWAMVHGSAHSPAIPQTRVPDWDSTGARSDIQAVSVRSSADLLATRVWITGSGEERGTVVTMAESLDFVAEGGPLLETVLSEPDQNSASRLYAVAAGELGRVADMVDQLTMTVRASDPKAPLGTWNVGDNANVTLAGHLSIPDGSRFMRILKASGDLADAVSIEFQEDSW